MRILIISLLLRLIGGLPTCPDGFSVLNDDTCVKLFKTPLLYQDALSNCKNFTGGHLVSLHNAIDNRALINLATSQGQTNPIWLGLICETTSWGLCTWEDESGYTSDYNAFANGEPYVGIGNNVYSLTTGGSAGKWISADGTITELAYFCEVPTNNATEFCPNEYNGHCYSLKMDLLDEPTARETCQKDFCGDLVSIHSKEENDHVYYLFPSTSSQYQYRIGAKTQQDGISLYWVDGSGFNYSNFGLYDPMIGMCSSASLYKDVVDSRQWMSNPCDEKMPFVCQRAKNGYPCASNPTQSPENPVTFEPVIPTSPPDDPRMCFHPLFFTGSGTIYSPYYPNNYTSVYSSPCKYIITVPAGTIAQIQFSPKSYIRYSKMEFYSQLEDGKQFANFTGHPPPYPLNSTTNVIKMVFTIYSDKQDNGVQWVASYGNNLTFV